MNDIVMINGKKVTIKPTKSRFTKTAFQMSQEIYSALQKIGITKEFVDLTLCRNPLKSGEPAQISWRVNDKDFYFQCNKQDRYVDNLGVITKVIEQESYAIRNGLKTFTQVMNQFVIGFEEGGEKILSPREIIGVDSKCNDLEYIKFKFKQKAKELHPDNGGNVNLFQKLNLSMEILEKELEEKK